MTGTEWCAEFGWSKTEAAEISNRTTPPPSPPRLTWWRVQVQCVSPAHKEHDLRPLPNRGAPAHAGGSRGGLRGQVRNLRPVEPGHKEIGFFCFVRIGGRHLAGRWGHVRVVTRGRGRGPGRWRSRLVHGELGRRTPRHPSTEGAGRRALSSAARARARARGSICGAGLALSDVASDR